MVAAVDRGAHRINPAAVPRISPNAASSQIAIRYGFKGPNMVVSTACPSGAHAIGEAFSKVQYGELDVCFTGGTEAPLTHFNFGAYCALRVLSKHNDDPAAASARSNSAARRLRDGRGRGDAHPGGKRAALRRGAAVLAEVIGYASNSGAHQW